MNERSSSIYKFAAADENEMIVFGAAKPGSSQQQVYNWINFMKQQGIQRVCCLLSDSQLARYENLLEIYQSEFGIERVCWAPIEDFQLAELETLTQKILPFLVIANQQSEKVVVHCSGGIGRTGHVLAAWLINSRGLSNKDAIAAVKRTGRNPHEAVIVALLSGRNPWKVTHQLNALLDNCRRTI
jgi:protein-tyrosine phosphatase